MYTPAERTARWRRKHPQRKKESARNQTLKKNGWTQVRFAEKREEQRDKCAICNVSMTFEERISKTRACTDHAHTDPPKPRDLLCSSCNTGIGLFYENEKLLEKAAEYLRKWR